MFRRSSSVRVVVVGCGTHAHNYNIYTNSPRQQHYHHLVYPTFSPYSHRPSKTVTSTSKQEATCQGKCSQCLSLEYIVLKQNILNISKFV